MHIYKINVHIYIIYIMAIDAHILIDVHLQHLAKILHTPALFGSRYTTY